MPYFDVFLNGERLVTAGDKNLTLMTVSSIIVLPAGFPHLLVNGMRKHNGNFEHFEWQNRELEYNDTIEVNFIDSPGVKKSYTPMRKKVEKMEIETKAEFFKKRSSTPSFKSINGRQLARVGYELVFDDSRRFSAIVSGTATTQVSATWHYTYPECKIELANLSESEGKLWMETYLNRGHSFSVRIKGEN